MPAASTAFLPVILLLLLLQAAVIVRVTNTQSGMITFWDLDKFESRLEQMREMHQQVTLTQQSPMVHCPPPVLNNVRSIVHSKDRCRHLIHLIAMWREPVTCWAVLRWTQTRSVTH